MLTHKGTQVIETPRLILRQFTVEDAQAMYDNWASDPEVTKFLTWPPHSNVELTRSLLTEWVGNYDRKNYYHWAITLKSNAGSPIGSLVANCQDDRIEKFHIGYCIGKAWWHQGIMSEALSAVMQYLFDEVGAGRIEARHDPNNPHSGDVMKKCGMKFEGIAVRSDWNNQGICDAAYYAMIKDGSR